MTRQIRTTLLTGLFFFGLLTSLQAQDKYEYATVALISPTNSYFLAVTLPDKYEEIDVAKDEVNGGSKMANLTPLIKKVNELAQQGWEAYDNTTSLVINSSQAQTNVHFNYSNSYYVYYFLRRKIA